VTHGERFRVWTWRRGHKLTKSRPRFRGSDSDGVPGVPPDAFRLQLYSLIAFAGLAGGLDGVGNVTTRDQSAVCPFDEPYAHAVITLD